MTKPTEKDTHGDKSIHGDKSKDQPMPEKGKPSKLRDDELDKVAGGIGGLGAPIPVKR
jgi:hypothetical protein